MFSEKTEKIVLTVGMLLICAGAFFMLLCSVMPIAVLEILGLASFFSGTFFVLVCLIWGRMVP